MSDAREINGDVNKLNFLYKKITAPYPSIRYWLSIPEFANEMLEMVTNGDTIDDFVVYESMSRIYQTKEKMKWKDKKGVFNYRLANAAIKSLRKRLYPE